MHNLTLSQAQAADLHVCTWQGACAKSGDPQETASQPHFPPLSPTPNTTTTYSCRQGRAVSVFDASQGSRLEALVALRDVLAREIDEAPGARDLAGLIKQLADVLAQIDMLAPPKERNRVDEIAARRAARRSANSPA